MYFKIYYTICNYKCNWKHIHHVSCVCESVKTWAYKCKWFTLTHTTLVQTINQCWVVLCFQNLKSMSEGMIYVHLPLEVFKKLKTNFDSWFTIEIIKNSLFCISTIFICLATTSKCLPIPPFFLHSSSQLFLIPQFTFYLFELLGKLILWFHYILDIHFKISNLVICFQCLHILATWKHFTL